MIRCGYVRTGPGSVVRLGSGSVVTLGSGPVLLDKLLIDSSSLSFSSLLSLKGYLSVSLTTSSFVLSLWGFTSVCLLLEGNPHDQSISQLHGMICLELHIFFNVVITFIPFLVVRISYKETSKGSWFEFFDVLVNIGNATKDSWFRIIVRWIINDFMQFLKWGFELYYPRQHTIHNICNRSNCFSPILSGYIHVKKRRTNDFQDLSIPSFGQPILLGCSST